MPVVSVGSKGGRPDDVFAATANSAQDTTAGTTASLLQAWAAHDVRTALAVR